MAVVEEGVLEDGDDGLLELDDLLLELVFGYCCGGLAVGVGWVDGRWGEVGGGGMEGRGGRDVLSPMANRLPSLP